ncbi:hypothetical protein Rhopal_002753-T1 [Rhodotorula paludigena]|uniref:SCP domain-containing protein n=1 Tax=Rhodotorula paludigena TaxID=86838 RepID=A0AAV5GKK5_9BASI|nr:hypothetical protein Rhopal_002753-T1 [Rhodotorula paludigena]
MDGLTLAGDLSAASNDCDKPAVSALKKASVSSTANVRRRFWQWHKEHSSGWTGSNDHFRRRERGPRRPAANDDPPPHDDLARGAYYDSRLEREQSDLEAAGDQHQPHDLSCTSEDYLGRRFGLNGGCGLGPEGVFEHGGGKAIHAGENLAAGTGLTAESGIQMWYNEVGQYDFDDPSYNEATGHFTQLVWKGTTEVGCALSTCSPVKGEGFSWNGNFLASNIVGFDATGTAKSFGANVLAALS